MLLFSHQVFSNSFATPWTVDHQASLSMRFPRQEYWSGSPFPSPQYLPKIGIKPMFPVLQVNSLPLSPQRSCYEILIHREKSKKIWSWTLSTNKWVQWFVGQIIYEFYNRNLENPPNILKLSDIHVNNPWVKAVTREIRKILWNK